MSTGGATRRRAGSTTTASTSPGGGAGTRLLLRWALRVDRVVLTGWVLGIVAVVAITSAGIARLYPSAELRQGLVAGLAASPAVRALIGTIPAGSVGGLTAWRIGVFGGAAVGIMAVLLLVRRTRTEEENGRTELLLTTAVTRSAPLRAGLVLAGGAGVAVGTLSAAVLVAGGRPLAGAVLFGGCLAGCGLVFTGLAAVTAQLFGTARTASAVAGAGVGLAYALRAVADVAPGAGGSGGHRWLGALGWLSPLGWLERAEAFGANRFAMLLLFVAAAGALMGTAAAMARRRDVGLALIPARRGPAAGLRLTSASALAARLHRGGLLGWTAGLFLVGVLTGTLADSVATVVADNPSLASYLELLGGASGVADAFVGAMAGVAGLLAAAAGISAGLRAAGEERAGRAELVLTGAVPRARWLLGHGLFALLVPTTGLLAAGVAAAVGRGLTTGGAASWAAGWDGLQIMAIQLPAALVLAALAIALTGLRVSLAGAAWLVLAAVVLLQELGPLLGWPEPVLTLNPFHALPITAAAPVPWGTELVLLAAAAALLAIGGAGLRRRDVG